MTTNKFFVIMMMYSCSIALLYYGVQHLFFDSLQYYHPVLGFPENTKYGASELIYGILGLHITNLIVYFIARKSHPQSIKNNKTFKGENYQ